MVKRDSDDLSKTTDTEAKHLIMVRIRPKSDSLSLIVPDS